MFYKVRDLKTGKFVTRGTKSGQLGQGCGETFVAADFAQAFCDKAKELYGDNNFEVVAFHVIEVLPDDFKPLQIIRNDFFRIRFDTLLDQVEKGGGEMYEFLAADPELSAFWIGSTLDQYDFTLGMTARERGYVKIYYYNADGVRYYFGLHYGQKIAFITKIMESKISKVM